MSTCTILVSTCTIRVPTCTILVSTCTIFVSTCLVSRVFSASTSEVGELGEKFSDDVTRLKVDGSLEETSLVHSCGASTLIALDPTADALEAYVECSTIYEK